MNRAKPLALVTGASSGIGLAFARRLGNLGYDLIVVGRRREWLDTLATELTGSVVRPVVADLGTDIGVDAVADLCAREPILLLVNNAGVAHYMAFTKLPADKASELLHVKVLAPTMLARAAAPGMVARGHGTIINVAGMLAFGAPAPLGQMPGRAVYVATLAHIVALSQALHEELKANGLKVQALCPGVVTTEFHERQGMDLSALPAHVRRRRGDRQPSLSRSRRSGVCARRGALGLARRNITRRPRSLRRPIAAARGTLPRRVSASPSYQRLSNLTPPPLVVIRRCHLIALELPSSRNEFVVEDFIWT